MVKAIFFILLLVSLQGMSQELFVNADPASNLPARSLNIKFTGHFVAVDKIYDRPAYRYMPQLAYGLTKNLLFQVGLTYANMHTSDARYESFYVYSKYRFLSIDDVHKHLRMAAFISGSKTAAHFHFDEGGLMGNKSGMELGLITTQLWDRLALSGTISHAQLLDRSRFDKVIYFPKRFYQLMNYSLSTGYLLLPKQYTSYKQVNINLYMEALAQQTLQENRYFIDLAPAVQAIFFSNTKLGVSYRFQVGGTMDRMSKNSWLISLDRSFLNVVKRKKA